MTLSPLRRARRSEAGFGNSSEGGSGGPMLAQAVSNRHRPNRQLVRTRTRMGIKRVSEAMISGRMEVDFVFGWVRFMRDLGFTPGRTAEAAVIPWPSRC